MELHAIVPMRLKHYRRKAGLTQPALARLLHMNNIAYRSIENGTHPFTIEEPANMRLVSNFCTALKISVAEFLCGSGNTTTREAEVLQLHWDLICTEAELITDINNTVVLMQKAAAMLKKEAGL